MIFHMIGLGIIPRQQGCIRFGRALLLAFVGEAEHDRLLGGRGALVWLDDRFTPTAPLLRPFRGALTALEPSESTDRL